MAAIPLFPLRTVLFPGMPLTLHVFEDRYRLLVSRCMGARQPFGVALIHSGDEVGRPAEPHRVGTTALISRAERLPDGRCNIEVIGQERFAIVALDHSEPYLSAEIAPFPLTLSDSAEAERLAGKLLPHVTAYLKTLGAAISDDFHSPTLPHSPTALAFVAALIAQIPVHEKQMLLSTATCEELLQRERSIYRREGALLRRLLSEPPGAVREPFSLN